LISIVSAKTFFFIINEYLKQRITGLPLWILRYLLSNLLDMTGINAKDVKANREAAIIVGWRGHSTVRSASSLVESLCLAIAFTWAICRLVVRLVLVCARD
jgi:hypothetical protein